MLQGESDLEQISLMIRNFGSIDEEEWPEARELPDYKKIFFEYCEGIPIRSLVPEASDLAVDFLTKVLK